MTELLLFELCVYRRSDKEIIYLKLFTSTKLAGERATELGYYDDKNLWVKITPIEVEK